jgi:hypothetical protein
VSIGKGEVKMKIALAILCALALCAGAAWGSNNWYVSTTGSNSNDGTSWDHAWLDIQFAIDNDYVLNGDVINVAAGTYSLAATVNITKSLTLLGPQAGVDPRPCKGTMRVPGSSSEAALEGGTYGLSIILNICAGNVVIDGFEVKSGKGDMIYQGATFSGAVVRYCIVHDGRGDEGVQLKKATNAVLEYNYVYDIGFAGDALNISDYSSFGSIRYNEVYNIGSENAAIYVYTAENMEVVGNLVHHITLNDGIKLGNKGGGDAGRRGALVKGNVVYDTEQDGISVYMSGVTVECNEVYDSHSENGAIYLAFAISDITISNNSVHGNVLKTGKRPTAAGILLENRVNAAAVTVNSNNIYNNTPYGMTNEAAATVNAENNWWGDASGPGPTGSGNPVSGNVDFDPWLLAKVPPCAPPVVPMTAFITDYAKIEFGRAPSTDKATVKGHFELDLVNGDGVSIDEDVIFSINGDFFTQTIKMTLGKKGRWEYKRPAGETGGIKDMKIEWKEGKFGKFELHIDQENMSGITNPVTFRLQIGDDVGEETVTMRQTPRYWEYKGGGAAQSVLEAAAPLAFALSQNNPNPFSRETSISFTLPVAGHTMLDIYDASGRLVETLVDREMSAGVYTVSWDREGTASGVYFYRLSSAGNSLTKKMVVVR